MLCRNEYSDENKKRKRERKEKGGNGARATKRGPPIFQWPCRDESVDASTERNFVARMIVDGISDQRFSEKPPSYPCERRDCRNAWPSGAHRGKSIPAYIREMNYNVTASGSGDAKLLPSSEHF